MTTANYPPGITDNTISDPPRVQMMDWDSFVNEHPDIADNIYRLRFLEVREAIDQIAADRMVCEPTRKTLLGLYAKLEQDALVWLEERAAREEFERTGKLQQVNP